MKLNDFTSIPEVAGSKPLDFTKPLKQSGKTFRKGTVVDFIELPDDLDGLNKVMTSQPFESRGEVHYADRIYCQVNGVLGWHNLSKFIYFNTARNLTDFDAFISETENEVVNEIRNATGYKDFYKAINGKKIVFADEFKFVFFDYNSQTDKEIKLAVYR